jgi:putative transposase
MRSITTLRFTRRNLPHWEVEGGRYFVTVHCADSLPREAVLRIDEIRSAITKIPPQSPQFEALQRQLFATAEKYLDAGHGHCILRKAGAAGVVVSELEELAAWDVDVPHHTIMPNHWHALFCPGAECTRSVSEIMKRIKGRSACGIRHVAGGRGPVWQREWFDRWIRDDAEWERTVAYIHANPVKAGLARHWTQYPWSR